MYNKHFLEIVHLIDIIKLFTNLQNCFLPLQLQIHHYWSKDPMNTNHYYLRRTLSMNLTEVHNKLDHFFHSLNSFFDSSQIHRLSYYRICILLWLYFKIYWVISNIAVIVILIGNYCLWIKINVCYLELLSMIKQ